MLYGFPGSGKTHFSRELCELIGAAHVQGDRIRHELFESPRYDKQENDVVTHLMEYMTEEFLNAGISVVFDINAMRLSQRRSLRDMARHSGAVPILIWLQIDTESAFQRTARRDRRKSDDKYAMPYTKESFENQIRYMQNPKDEDYVVISGKHTFNTQRNAIMKKLYDMRLINVDSASANVVKPGMINLIPNPLAGRVDPTRRNIVVR